MLRPRLGQRASVFLLVDFPSFLLRVNAAFNVAAASQTRSAPQEISSCAGVNLRMSPSMFTSSE